jgi:DNA-binding transcriptional LysR family regulator
LEEADEAAGAQQETPRGQLRVYCQQGIEKQFVAPVIVDFLARHPEASVDLRTGHAMIDLVQEAFDLAISAQSNPDSTLVRRHLATLSLMLCGARAYLEKHRPNAGDGGGTGGFGAATDQAPRYARRHRVAASSQKAPPVLERRVGVAQAPRAWS